MTQERADNIYTRKIAHFVADLNYKTIPTEVSKRIKILMLDAFGCGIYGAKVEWSHILRRAINRLDKDRTSTIWGTKEKFSAPNAALINGTQVQGFELDDAHHGGVVHVGAVVLPSLLAIAENKGGMSGQEFIASAVAGYEIGPRVGICMRSDHIGQGWHPAGTIGIFAAACGVARGLKLDWEKTVHALGHAGSQSSGLMAAQYGAMVKRMHAGHAAQSALYGACIAEEGFTGITDVFESPYGGFCSTFSRSQDRFDLPELTAGLGEVWETMNVSLKFYSCVFSGHTAIDGIRELQSEYPFGAKDIEKIIVHSSKVSAEHVGWKYKPEGMTAAQLNLPYCIATLLIEGDVFVDQFTDAAIFDEGRIALADKIEVIEDPRITEKGRKFRHMVRVEVFLKNGKHLERTVELARGSEKKFSSDAEIIEKFDKLVRHVMPVSQMNELKDMVLNLEKFDDMSKLAKLLAC
jgi:2-methylcitrate dehydratase PrpD